MTPETLETDLARAQQGQARERSARTRRFLIPIGIAAAAAGIVTVTMLNGGSADPEAPVQAGAPTSSSSSDTTDLAISLVSYSGKQPVGFTIDKVPDGWEVQAVNTSELLVAPPGANQDPSNYEGKIYVSLSPDLSLDDLKDKRSIKVGDATGTLYLMGSGWDMEKGEGIYGPDSSTGLVLPGDLTFQFPAELKWDDATIAEFAAGVHSTDDAVPGLG
ncbi:hypothetical protein JCM9957A_11980 [Kineosporia succinea]